MSHFLHSTHSSFFHRCLQSRHNEPFLSLQPLVKSIRRFRREYMDFFLFPSLIEIRASPPLWCSHCLETLPQDLRCILERRAPIRNGAHPNWHLAGHGRLACSQVPAAVLRACTLGRASIIHCLLFINNPPLRLLLLPPPSSPPPHPPPPLLLHTHTPPLSLLPSPAHPYLHFYISHTIFYFIDISHRLRSPFFHSASDAGCSSAERYSMSK